LQSDGFRNVSSLLSDILEPEVEVEPNLPNDDLSAEEQLQQEQRQSLSQDPELNREDQHNIAAELGRHLLQFHGCEAGAHNLAREKHFQDPRRLTNHYSLSDLEPITGQLLDVLSQPGLLKHSNHSRKQEI
jgi:hypothetical protein